MFRPHDEHTIVAQCTPSGKGALALLRLSGPAAFEIATALSKLPSNKQITDLPTHTIHFGWVTEEDNTPLDQVLFLLMRAPKTFTGQDVVEITCHNNQFIIQAIIARAIACGARLAQEGEFSRRAVANKKMDLVQAEALHDLIHAQTQMALKKSLAQLSGSFSSWITQIEHELLKALALSEASFEFLDEEMEFAPQIKALIDQILATIESLKKTYDQQAHIRQGIRIALIGSVNVGKSSLFNALLQKDRAIVTDIAGTTRDAIEAGLYRHGAYWTLVDTAGLRQTADVVEQEGIRRSFEEAQKADIILLVYDAARQLTEQEEMVYAQIQQDYASKVMVVMNKIDIALEKELIKPVRLDRTQRASGEVFQPSPRGFGGQAIRGIHPELVEGSTRTEKSTVRPEGAKRVEGYERLLQVSTKQPDTVATLEATLQEKINQLLASLDSPFLLNKRQYNLLLQLAVTLQEITGMLDKRPVHYELLSAHLQEALVSLSELTGKTISEAGMDMVFREFCVGK